MNSRWTGKAVVMAILSLLIIGGAVVIPQFASAGGGVSHVSAVYSKVNGTLGDANGGMNYYSIEFTVGSSNQVVNFISFHVWYNAASWANITYFIGTTVGGNNVLANRSANFTGNGWHNITFPSVSLSAGTDYYFTLHPVASSGGMNWNDTTPTATQNFVGEYAASTYALLKQSTSADLYTTGVTVYNIGGSYTLYSVTYTETGLASGTNWSVNQSGIVKYSTTPSIVYDELNGSYAFSIPSVPGYTVSPSSGTATVNGANITEAITFLPMPKYSLNFTESGLPSRTLWSVNLSGSIQSSNKSYIAFQETNGTYSYSIGIVAGYAASPNTGSVTLSGAAKNVSIAWTQVRYQVSFNETGLPSGTKWFLNFSDTLHNSTNKFINLTEPNGTYSFSVVHLTGYKNTPLNGTVKVNGSGVSDKITFTAYPTAVITAPSLVPYDSAVVLSASGSIGNITNYTWHIKGPQNFTEYGKTPSVFFSLTGTYSVSLTVTNTAGLANNSVANLSVVSSSQDPKIAITLVRSTLGNGTIEYSITVTAKDNVSISSVTVMVGKAYVNVTLTKQTGYEYYYTLYLLPSKYAYGNYTVKITAWNSLDRYNSLTTYLTFGSISQGGLFDYIISHSVLAIMFGIVVVLLIILIFVGEEHFEALHGKNGKKKRGGEKGGKKR